MNKSAEIDKLAEALAKAQSKIENATKSATNPFFRSKYADLPAVWAACRDHLTENGLAVTHLTDTGENGILLETVLMHSSGQWISSLYPVNPLPDKEGRQTPQGLGSAISYARRYALMALVGIVADFEDDDGEKAMGRSYEAVPKPSQREAIHGPSTLKQEGIGATNEAAAKDWAMKAITAIRAASKPELRAWEKLNEKAMDKLEKSMPELYQDIQDNVDARYETFPSKAEA